MEGQETNNTATAPAAAPTTAEQPAATGQNVPTAENGGGNIFNFPNAGQAANTPAQPAAQPEAVIDDSYQFKIADGLELNEAMSKDFLAIAKDMKLTPAQADKLVDLYSSQELAKLDAMTAQRDEWANETVKAGLATPEGQQQAKLALDRYGGEDAKRILVESNLIYHPAIFGLLKNIGAAISEDTGAEGQGTFNTATIGQKYFPNSNMN